MEGSIAVKPHLFEQGDRIFLVAPVSPFKPGEEEIKDYAYGPELEKTAAAVPKEKATNPNFLWLRGNYVEADNPNANGDTWTAKELSIKSLTPMYCPVTVMHDPRTAVGLIADSRLMTPAKDNVPRARIETTLAIWAHRFPDVVEEIAHNYEHGSLMQSMECQAPYYSCNACGQMFHKLPEGRERDLWCEHLAENPNASRTLGGVTFTGTGLIFGSRGAEGAYSEAFLEQAVRDEIVAAHDELHERTSKPSSQTKPRRSVIQMEMREVPISEFDELRGRPTQEEFTAETKRADDAAEELAAAQKAVEEAEAAQKKAEKERDDFKEKAEKAEEEQRAQELSSERIGKLGKDFTEALGEKTRARLNDQAATMEDEEWEARLEELEDLTEVKRDAGTGEPDDSAANGGGTTVTREETAASRLGPRSTGDDTAPSDVARSSVIGGLVRSSGKS